MSESVRFIINEKEDLGKSISDTLEQMAATEGVVKPVVALPDIHYKGSYHTPTGVVAMTDGRIIPKFINPNCGMSFVSTAFNSEDLSADKIDIIYAHLKENISDSTRIRPVINDQDLDDIILNGAEWALRKFGLNMEDLKNFENGGSLFKGTGISSPEIKKYIPESCLRMGKLSLNVLGYGNHFIEMQEVDEIYDENAARLFGIGKNRICFMLHGDSRAFGRSISDFYSKKAKKLFGLQQIYKKFHYGIMASEKIPDRVKTVFEKFNYKVNRFKSGLIWKMNIQKANRKYSFPSISKGTEEEKAFKLSAYAAQNFGYANRASMIAVIRDAMKKAFNGDNSDLRILYDGNHDCLQEERVDGVTYLAHRNGASRAGSSREYREHPVFSRTGQPVLLPSSMGNPSFLMAAYDGSKGSFYSAPHGAGRIIDRGEAREKFGKNDVIALVESRGMRVYDYGKGNVSEESPAAFKDIDSVVEVVSKSGIAKPVAKMRPLAVLKGWT